jgi:hypothetical protein
MYMDIQGRENYRARTGGQEGAKARRKKKRNRRGWKLPTESIAAGII